MESEEDAGSDRTETPNAMDGVAGAGAVVGGGDDVGRRRSRAPMRGELREPLTDHRRRAEMLAPPHNLDPDAPVCSCVFCEAVSTEVRWYAVIALTTPTGNVLLRPDGDQCFQHGAACRVYPRFSVEQLLMKVEQEQIFKCEFEEVAERVLGITERMFKHEQVSRVSSLSTLTFLDLGAIPLTSFMTKYSPPSTTKTPTAIIPCPPSRMQLECVMVYPISTIPSDLFYFTHRISVGDNTDMLSVVLDGNALCRMNQASDTFDLELGKHFVNRDGMWLANGLLGKAINSMEDIRDKHETAQRRIQQEAANAGTSSAVVAAEVLGGAVLQRMEGGVATSGPSLRPPDQRGRRAAVSSGAPPPAVRRRIDAAPPRRPLAVKAERGPLAEFGFVADGAPVEAPAPAFPEAPAEDPNWEAILLNKAGDLGRELRGAEQRLDAMMTIDEGAPETINMGTLVGDLSACLMVKLDKVKTIDEKTLQDNIAILLQDCIDIPNEAAQHYTAKLGRFRLGQRILSEDRDAAIATWALTSVCFDSSQPDDSWGLEADMRFQNCAPQSKEECEEQKFKKTFNELIFNDSFCAAWKALLTVNQGDPTLILAMAHTFLNQWATIEDSLDEWQLEVVSASLSTFRFVIAEYWPVPLAYGSSINDVLYILPDSKRAKVVKDVEKIGKWMASTAAADEQLGERKATFKQYSGAEATFGNDAWMFYLDLSSPVMTCTFEKVKECLDVWVKRSLEWTRLFRPGFAAPYETLFTDRINTYFKEDLPAATYADLGQAVAKMQVVNAKRLHTKLLQFQKSATSRDAIERLAETTFVFSSAASFELVPELHDMIGVVIGQGALSDGDIKLVHSCSDSFLFYLKSVDTILDGNALKKGVPETAALVRTFAKVLGAKTDQGVLAAVAGVFTAGVKLQDAHGQMLDRPPALGSTDVPSEMCAALESLIVLNSSASSAWPGFPETKLALAFTALCEKVKRDIGKQRECIDTELDHAFMQHVHAMEEIAGGAARGQFWWGDFTGAGKDLPGHFENTLEKVNINQICDRNSTLMNKLEKYMSERAGDAEQERITKLAVTALRIARVTNLEYVILKTHKKSRAPKTRIETCLSNFDCEEFMGVRRAALACVGPPMKDFLHVIYDLIAPVEVSG